MKDTVNRGRGWSDTQFAEKERFVGLGLWCPLFFEVNTSAKGHDNIQNTPAFRNLLTNYKKIAHDQQMTAEDCSSAPYVVR